MQWANIKRSLALIVLQFVSCDGVVMFFCSSGAVAESIVGSFGAGAVLTLCGSSVGL